MEMVGKFQISSDIVMTRPHSSPTTGKSVKLYVFLSVFCSDLLPTVTQTC